MIFVNPGETQVTVGTAKKYTHYDDGIVMTGEMLIEIGLGEIEMSYLLFDGKPISFTDVPWVRYGISMTDQFLKISDLKIDRGANYVVAHVSREDHRLCAVPTTYRDPSQMDNFCSLLKYLPKREAFDVTRFNADEVVRDISAIFETSRCFTLAHEAERYIGYFDRDRRRFTKDPIKDNIIVCADFPTSPRSFLRAAHIYSDKIDACSIHVYRGASEVDRSSQTKIVREVPGHDTALARDILKQMIT